MADKKPYKLRLTKLEFLSSCDVPAQGAGGAALLCKRGSDDFKLTAKVSKLSDDLGLVFGYAFAASLDGGQTPHIDSQDDAIDPDFLKTVTAFLEAGGATDVNHDFAQDGKIVYAWPLLPEINEAMGIKSDVVGLAVAVKPSAETYKAFKSGELTGFSIAGTGIREPLEKSAPGRVVKSTLYTDLVDGHQHEVYVCDDGTLYVRYATSEGADREHSHGIVFENGQLTILADSGHTHQLAEGQPGVAIVPADAIVVVAASAKSGVFPTKSVLQVMRDNPQAVNAIANKSTRSTSNNEATSMANDQQIADLTKRLEHAERIAKMTGVHKTHFDTLQGDEAEAFLAKSAKERDAEIAEVEKADAPIWTGEVTKVAVRKSDGALALQLAKQNEVNAVALAKREAEIEKADIRKQAGEVLGGMPGDDATHDAIIGALRKNLSGEALDKAIATLKGMKAESRIGKAAPGFSGSSPTTDDSPMAKFNVKLAEFAKSKNQTPVEATGAFVETPEGASLYDELLASQH